MFYDNISWVLEERFFSEHRGPKEGYLIYPGRGTVVLTASHSADYGRLGEEHKGEYYTGVFCKYLNKLAGTPAMVKTQYLGDDANWDYPCEFKKRVKSVVGRFNSTMLIDLHICSEANFGDIEIGTNDGANLNGQDWIVSSLEESFNQIYDKVVVDEIFAATYGGTVAAYIAKQCGIATVQLSLNWRNLTDNEGRDRMLHALMEAVKELRDRHRCLILGVS